MEMLSWALLGCLLCSGVNGLGCMKTICDTNEANDLRPCPDSDGECGSYGGLRDANQKLKAVDIKCSAGNTIHAPFSGTMEFWRPFGGSNSVNDCADKGARIEGEGQWQGYVVYISYVDLYDYGGRVEAGDAIGTMTNYLCIPLNRPQHTSHLRIKLTKEGQEIDPTYHLHDCMCTGQICESNAGNSLIGQPFKTDSAFNGVRGFELSCPDTQDFDELSENLVDPDTVEWRAPEVRAPIDAEVIGRVRLSRTGGTYKGCENDGIFLVGTGKWKGFGARIYNAKFSSSVGLGQKRIDQGQVIGSRLHCPELGINSIFVEIRRNGRIFNATDMLTANNCQLPPIPTL